MALAPRARVDDPEKLADDANRSVAARAPLVTRLQRPPATTLQRTGLVQPAPAAGLPVEPGLVNPVTGIVEPRFNLGAAFNQAEVPTGVGGERLVPFTPPVDTTPSFAQAVAPTTAATPAVAPLATTPAPAVGNFLAAGTPAAATAGPQPRGFTLDQLLQASGPAQTGLGTLGALGVGSSLVAQNQSEIDTDLGRERAATEGLRAGQELESQIASRGAQADVATASAEKIGFENRVNELRVAQGLSPIGGKAETFKTSVVPADIVSGVPAQLLRAGSRGGSELRPASEGGFAAAVAQGGPDPIATRIAAIDGFKAANPQFKDATDQEVLTELQRQFDAQGAQ